MHYILILWVAGGSVAMTEFGTLSNCMTALSQVTTDWNQNAGAGAGTLKGICTPK